MVYNNVSFGFVGCVGMVNRNRDAIERMNRILALASDSRKIRLLLLGSKLLQVIPELEKAEVDVIEKYLDDYREFFGETVSYTDIITSYSVEQFWNDVKDLLINDGIPFTLLFDLYEIRMLRYNLSNSLSRKQFSQQLCDLVEKDATWMVGMEGKGANERYRSIPLKLWLVVREPLLLDEIAMCNDNGYFDKEKIARLYEWLPPFDKFGKPRGGVFRRDSLEVAVNKRTSPYTYLVNESGIELPTYPDLDNVLSYKRASYVQQYTEDFQVALEKGYEKWVEFVENMVDNT